MRRKGFLSTLILILVFLVGLSVMLYPTISDFLNSRQQKESIIEYDRLITDMDKTEKNMIFAKAEAYNKELSEMSNPFELADEISDYDDILNVSGTGVIGYISIDRIKTELPIYHGTSDQVLNVAVGHIKGSSFPIGGESTHSVISAHRGLPSAKLFTDLDQIEIGDTFKITVLDRVLHYSVDKISIVYPDDFSKLQIEKGKDYVTLVTCTPYGVNTQRLLVRGKRIAGDDEDGYSVNVQADAFQVEPLLVAPLIAIPLLLMLVVIFTTGSFRRRRLRRKHLLKKVKDIHSYSNDEGGGDNDA